jgi:hypothetical protein
MSAVAVDGNDEFDVSRSDPCQPVERGRGEAGKRRVLDRQLGDRALPLPRSRAVREHQHGRYGPQPILARQSPLHEPLAGTELEGLLPREGAELRPGERLDAPVDVRVPQASSRAERCHSGRAARPMGEYLTVRS